MSREHPTGVLGWSEDDFAEYSRSGAWPEREAQPTSEHLGLSLTGEVWTPAKTPPPSDDVGQALRAIWRAAVMPEAMREAKSNLARSRAAKSVEKRRAKASIWKGPAEIATQEILSKNAQARTSEVVLKIRTRLKARDVACPGRRTLERLVGRIRTGEKSPT